MPTSLPGTRATPRQRALQGERRVSELRRKQVLLEMTRAHAFEEDTKDFKLLDRKGNVFA